MTVGILAYGHDAGSDSTARFIGLPAGTWPDWFDVDLDAPSMATQFAGRLLDQAGAPRPDDPAEWFTAIRQDLGVDLVEHGAPDAPSLLVAANGSVRRAEAGDPVRIRNLIAPDMADEHIASAVGSLGLDVPATAGWLITATGG